MGCHFRDKQTQVYRDHWIALTRSFLVRLQKWWSSIFPDSALPNLDPDGCPMLIEIMQHTSSERDDFSLFEYQPLVLQHCDLSLPANKTSTVKIVLETLSAFREEWQRKQQFLVALDVVRSTGMCPDVLVEISKYLTLNDAINAFSIDILPLLREARTRVQLVNPSDRFLEMVRQHLDPSQVTSIRLPGALLESTQGFSALFTFNRLISVSVVNPGSLVSLGRCLEKFSTVRAVYLWCESEFRFNIFTDLLSSPFNRITRLEIHCAGTSCDHYAIDQRRDRYPRNDSIETFVFDAGHFPLAFDRFCPSEDRFCFLRSAVEFIQSLVNVRRVRFITNRREIVTFLRADQWQQLITECLRLEQVIIQLVDGGEFAWEAEKIEEQLRVFRPGMIFRIGTVWLSRTFSSLDFIRRTEPVFSSLRSNSFLK